MTQKPVVSCSSLGGGRGRRQKEERGRGNEERKKEHLPQDDGRNKVNKLTPRACSPSINNGVRAARPL